MLQHAAQWDGTEGYQGSTPATALPRSIAGRADRAENSFPLIAPGIRGYFLVTKRDNPADRRESDPGVLQIVSRGQCKGQVQPAEVP